MIKINYEGAWKELEENISIIIGIYDNYINAILGKKVETIVEHIKGAMDLIVQRHTQDVIKLKRNTDQEMLNYYMKKFTEIYLENINLREKLKKLNDRPIKPERMDYMEKGAAFGKPRIFNKRKYEEKMDKWFNDLSDSQKADIAYNFWDSASYEDKKEEYELE